MSESKNLAEQLSEKYGIEISAAEVDENGLNKITVSGNVREIPARKFKSIKEIAQVVIEDGVTSIGDYAFDNCGLTSVTLPGSVKSIGKGVFDHCDNLRSICYQGDLKGWLGIEIADMGYNNNPDDFTRNNLYINGELLEGDLVIPEGVKKIGDYVFQGCRYLTSVTISDGVTSIGNYAFRGCGWLTSVTIPGSVKSIGENSFQDCTVTDVYYQGDVKRWLELGIADIKWFGPRRIATPYIHGKMLKGNLVIPEGVEKIGDQAFSGCCDVISVTIPSSVKSIGFAVFSGCDRLKKIEVQNGNEVFHSSGNCVIETKSKTLILGCKKSVIPKDGSVTSIGPGAFFGCVGLWHISVPDCVTSIGDQAFVYTSLLRFNTGKGVRSIGDLAFAESKLRHVIIGENVTRAAYLFEYCYSLKRITVKSSNVLGGPAVWTHDTRDINNQNWKKKERKFLWRKSDKK